MQSTSELALRVIESMAASQNSLKSEDEQDLAQMLEQMVLRYPHQDLKQSLEGYYQDYIVLVRRYGIEAVRQALQEYRVMPGQRFFPQPSECAEIAEVIVKNQQEENKKPAFTPCGDCFDGLRTTQRETMIYGQPRMVRVMVECSCLRSWKSQNRPAVMDGKVMAANG